MKVSRTPVEPVFTPVTIVCETQAELNLIRNSLLQYDGCKGGFHITTRELARGIYETLKTF